MGRRFETKKYCCVCTKSNSEKKVNFGFKSCLWVNKGIIAYCPNIYTTVNFTFSLSGQQGTAANMS